MTVLKAAKDRGDAKGDKTRRGTVNDLVARANVLSTEVDLTGYPEVKEAITSVKTLADITNMLEVQAMKLKNTTGDGAAEAQKALDETRVTLDAMLPAVVATFTAVESTLKLAIQSEFLFQTLETKMKEAGESLKTVKDRLAAAAKSLQSARSIG